MYHYVIDTGNGACSALAIMTKLRSICSYLTQSECSVEIAAVVSGYRYDGTQKIRYCIDQSSREIALGVIRGCDKVNGFVLLKSDVVTTLTIDVVTSFMEAMERAGLEDPLIGSFIHSDFEVKPTYCRALEGHVARRVHVYARYQCLIATLLGARV